MEYLAQLSRSPSMTSRISDAVNHSTIYFERNHFVTGCSPAESVEAGVALEALNDVVVLTACEELRLNVKLAFFCRASFRCAIEIKSLMREIPSRRWDK